MFFVSLGILENNFFYTSSYVEKNILKVDLLIGILVKALCGASACHFAAETGNIYIVEALLNNGARSVWIKHVYLIPFIPCIHKHKNLIIMSNPYFMRKSMFFHNSNLNSTPLVGFIFVSITFYTYFHGCGYH